MRACIASGPFGSIPPDTTQTQCLVRGESRFDAGRRFGHPDRPRLAVHTTSGRASMSDIDKKSLTERDISTKFINPALEAAGWDLMHQIREQYYFTDGRVMVRGKTVKRGDRTVRR